MNLSSDYKELLQLLSTHGARYLIIGGYAFGFHARPRFTHDLDIWVSPTRDNALAVYRALAHFGAPLDQLGVGLKDLEKTDQFIRIGQPPGSPIDLHTAVKGLGDFEDSWARRVEADMAGTTIFYLSIDDLLRSKQAAGRSKDLKDSQDIIRLKKRLRWKPTVKRSSGHAPPSQGATRRSKTRSTQRKSPRRRPN